MRAGARSDSTGARAAAALALLGVALGTYLRLSGALASPLFGDEFHAVRTAGESLATVLTTFDELGSHVALPLLQWLSAQLVERGLLAFRLPALVPGILTLVVLYPIARRLVGRGPAALATLALALSPMHVYYSRFGRSYALTVFLGVLLLGTLNARAGRWRSACIVLLAGLLPYVHLASAGYVGALALAALLVPGEQPHDRRKTLASFAAAVALCALLFWPVREALWAYVTHRAEGPRDRPHSPLGIALLLGGGVTGMVTLALGVPLGLLLFERGGARGRQAHALLAAACLGPLVWLLGTRPHGMEYAWSRYLLLALPAAWMLAAVAWTSLAGRLLPGVAGERFSWVLGSLLLCVAFAAGPARRVDDAPFGNTYAALRDLPAFDAADPGASELYARLAEDPEVSRIVEAPDMHSRALLMFRNRRLVHGKQVALGLASARDDARLGGAGPYVFLSRNACRAAGVQVVVLHKDLTAELEDYWRFVYEEAWPAHRSLGDAGLMERHRTYFLPGGDPEAYATGLRPVLENRFGEPFFEDQTLVAWRLP